MISLWQPPAKKINISDIPSDEDKTEDTRPCSPTPSPPKKMPPSITMCTGQFKTNQRSNTHVPADGKSCSMGVIKSKNITSDNTRKSVSKPSGSTQPEDVEDIRSRSSTPSQGVKKGMGKSTMKHPTLTSRVPVLTEKTPTTQSAETAPVIQLPTTANIPRPPTRPAEKTTCRPKNHVQTMSLGLLLMLFTGKWEIQLATVHLCPKLTRPPDACVVYSSFRTTIHIGKLIIG